MPKQYSIFGRPVVIRAPPRRFQLIFLLALVVVALIFVATPSNGTPPGAKLSTTSAVTKLSEEIEKTTQRAAEIVPQAKVPKLWNPFGTAAHEPPHQANSDHGDTTWYSDLQWLNPFSSQITLDEDRAVLPPLVARTPIYTFYDAAQDTDKKVLDAQNELLLTWRRAWWAKGFRPVVLGRAEAKNHPLYTKLEKSGSLPKEMKNEIERWLAWEHMGGGILADWLAFPMGLFNDPVFTTLRQHPPSKLGVQNGILKSSKETLSTALTKLFNAPDLSKSSLLAELPKDFYSQEQHANGIAFYELQSLSSKYKAVADTLKESEAAGLIALNKLINTHLHTAFLNSYPSGIAVLKPDSEHMTQLVRFATKLAKVLVSCTSDSPMPSSCPPNLSRCKLCSEDRPLPITFPSSLKNETELFTIGTVPHPLTFASLSSYQGLEDVTPAFIRRFTLRDAWLNATTAEMLGSKVGGPQRLPVFKEAVASPNGGIASRSLWFTAESQDHLDLEWVLGFTLPRSTTLEDDVINQSSDVVDGASVNSTGTTAEIKQETFLLKVCSDILAAKVNYIKGPKSSPGGRRRDLVESWNLADAEAWRFVRAYGARLTAERERWEKEEKGYAGSVEGRGGRAGSWGFS